MFGHVGAQKLSVFNKLLNIAVAWLYEYVRRFYFFGLCGTESYEMLVVPTTTVLIPQK